jgi:hypothetical protein
MGQVWGTSIGRAEANGAIGLSFATAQALSRFNRRCATTLLLGFGRKSSPRLATLFADGPLGPSMRWFVESKDRWGTIGRFKSMLGYRIEPSEGCDLKADCNWEPSEGCDLKADCNWEPSEGCDLKADCNWEPSEGCDLKADGNWEPSEGSKACSSISRNPNKVPRDTPVSSGTFRRFERMAQHLPEPSEGSEQSRGMRWNLPKVRSASAALRFCD